MTLSATVIVNNRNYGRYLGAAIDSALGQTRAAEVIVVDDGSDDDSIEVLESYEDRVIALRQAHSGQAAALNRGISVATGDVLMLLDSDDLMDQHKVERIMTEFEGRSRVEWARHDMRAVFNGRLVADSYYPLRGCPDPWSEVRHIGDATGTTSALAFSTELLKRVGPIPESRYPTYADWYLKVVASMLGECATINEALGTRRLHARQVTSHDRKDIARATFYLALGDSIACDAARQAGRHGAHSDMADGRLWWQQKFRFEAHKGGVVKDDPSLPFLIGMLAGLAGSDLPLARRAAMAARELSLAVLPSPWFRRAWWWTHFGRGSGASKLRAQ